LRTEIWKGQKDKARLVCAQKIQPTPDEVPTKRQLVLIENLVRVLQNGVNDPNLPAGVGDGGAGVGAHERGAKDDGEVM
jgi:hypothetical protein